MANLKQRIEDYFEVSKYNTSISKEILAGLATYLSLAYIFIVNPAILSNTGMNVTAVFFATVFASSLTTILMGVYARLPFALAPGLEMNGFFAFVVVGTLGLTWNQALGVVFWSGVLCIIFSYWTSVRINIVNAIPNGLKKSLAISVGVFVMTIGLFLSGLVQFTDGKISAVSFSFTPKVIALLIGLVISIVLGFKKLKFPGGMLIAIIVAAVYCKVNNIVVVNPATLNWDEMKLAIFKLDLIPTVTTIPVFIVFFLIDFYGSIGKFIGLTSSTNLAQKDGTPPRIEKAMGVDGIGTVLGSLVGTSSIITYVESAVGIQTGGRTGIVAIVCGLLMLASFAFIPLVGLVPVQATSGILIYVGYLLMKDVDSPDDKNLDRFFKIIVVIMGIISLLTFSLDKAMLLGFVAYTIRQIVVEKTYNWYLIASTVLIAVGVILPYILRM